MKTIKKLFRNFMNEYKATTRVTNNLKEYHAMEAVYYQTGML